MKELSNYRCISMNAYSNRRACPIAHWHFTRSRSYLAYFGRRMNNLGDDFIGMAILFFQRLKVQTNWKEWLTLSRWQCWHCSYCLLRRSCGAFFCLCVCDVFVSHLFSTVFYVLLSYGTMIKWWRIGRWLCYMAIWLTEMEKKWGR